MKVGSINTGLGGAKGILPINAFNLKVEAEESAQARCCREDGKY